jgi:23S rRNA (adenine2030-N6)-methyltransferase
MNYRHHYHAGNFADVLKHAVLCWTVKYLQQKEAPVCCIDTHAGRGVYDLSAPEALKTGEAADGILRLLGRTDVPAALAPYLELVGAAGPQAYPGSPLLLAGLARRQDRVIACELHPAEAAALRDAARGVKQLQVLEADGYRRLVSLIPPQEKRGIVVIDPPFEQPDELSALAAAFIAAHRKWPTGVFILWFPVKDRTRFERFQAELKSALIPKLSLLTLDVDRAEGLSATGLVLANAPFTLRQEWEPTLTWLRGVLAQGPRASAGLTSLAG